MYSLPVLLKNLKFELDETDAIYIVDESPNEIFLEIQKSCIAAMQGSKGLLFISNNEFKSGRGASIRRGIIKSIQLFPNLEHIIECDADGSHQTFDIISLKRSKKSADLLIGSRYLNESKIIGWPISRSILSRILNFSIPRIIGVQVSDITNGLRRYSRSAFEAIVATTPETNGFIYLTEIALLIKKKGLIIDEVPTTFVNRTIGESTVTLKELSSAAIGLFLIMKKVV